MGSTAALLTSNNTHCDNSFLRTGLARSICRTYNRIQCIACPSLIALQFQSSRPARGE